MTQLPTGQAPSAGKHTRRCTPTGESSKPAPPSFDWMLLGTGRYQVGSDGCSPYRMLLGTGRYQVGSDGCSPHRMLLGTGRYQVGGDGCSPYRMLLGTGRYQVGSDGCSPYRMLLGTATLPGWRRWMLALSDASRNRTLPGWERWMLALSDASRNRDVTRLAAMDARPTGCSSKRTSLRRPGGNADCCLSPTPTPAAWTSSNL